MTVQVMDETSGTRPRRRTETEHVAELRRRHRELRLRMVNRRLNAAKEKTGSDWKTAQELHLSPRRLSDIRKGRRPIPAETAVRLARLIGEHVFTALARAMADKAKTRNGRRFWLNVGVGLWPLVPDSYADWAQGNRAKRKKYTTGGY